MLEPYDDRTGMRSIILAVTANIPVIGGVVTGLDTYLTGQLQEARQDRLYALMDEIETGERPLTRKVAISDPVIYAAHITIEATIRTQRIEKVRAFARLLRAGIEDEPRLDLETEHEDFLKILDDLSYREVGLLATLEEFEKNNPILEGDNALQRSHRFWDDFVEQVTEEYSIQVDELDAWMTRLNRTGTYETFTGSFLGYTGGKGKLTPTYYRLSSLIRSQPGILRTGKTA